MALDLVLLLLLKNIFTETQMYKYFGVLTHSNFHSVVVKQFQESTHFLRSGVMGSQGATKIPFLTTLEAYL